jgi:Tat protein translocase TatB subunit
MFLFILESLGTSELILIGILALILFGPRKLPELARKAGKIMAEFRGTAAEFKETWAREVNFEEEVKALTDINLDDEIKSLSLDDADDEPLSHSSIPNNGVPDNGVPEAPAINEVDPSKFDGLVPDQSRQDETETIPLEKDKKNWL